MRWNPYSHENNQFLIDALRAAKIAGIVSDAEFHLSQLVSIVDNAIEHGLASDMSRDEALLVVALWMGRYQGNQDSGWWKPVDLTGKTEIERAKECCQLFIEASEEGDNKAFWIAFSRLVVALGDLHPENDLLPRVPRQEE